MAKDEDPKLIIDNDWKRQAQEEKKRLAEKEKAEAQEKQPSRPEVTGRGQLPSASFEALISTFATQTLLALGLMEHPSMGRMINLDLAKFNIDLLGIIEEKTKGNLSQEEKEVLDQTLHQLRMAFVEVAAAHAGPIGSQ